MHGETTPGKGVRVWLLLLWAPAVVLAACASPSGAASRSSSDPRQGPHAREEARHGSDAPALRPARTAVELRPLAAGPRSAVYPARIGLNREVFGFAPYWQLPNQSQWNYGLLTTVAYFGLDVRGDGSFDTSTAGWSGWTSQDLTNLVGAAHGSGDRVVLVIKQFDEATINQIVTTPAATQAAISNALNAVAGRGLDGVNVDFEGYASPSYPGIQGGLTRFVAQLSSQVHQRWPSATVSVDTYGGSAADSSGIFKIDELAPVVDAIFVMAYDMVFSNMPGKAGPNAPLDNFAYNDRNIVRQYLARAPAAKVILGVPYYGYKWSTSSSQPYAPATGSATGVSYAGIQDDFACATQLSRLYDSSAQSPWASWWSPASGDPCGGNHDSWRELYYDDAQSLGLKYDLVNANQLRGAGIWALGYDGTRTELWAEIAAKFAVSWSLLGPSLTAKPSASSWGPNRLDVFLTGADGALWHVYWAGGAWSPGESLGGYLTSGPAAVAWAGGRIDVFARGRDAALWHRYWDGAAWSAWEWLGGVLTTGPAVTSWRAGRLDVFVGGGDAAVWHTWFDTGWSGWEWQGGQLAGDPGAAAWAPGHVDLFVRGADQRLWHKWFDTGWSRWEQLLPALSSGPGVSTWGPGRLDVFAGGLDGAIDHTAYSGAWSAWQSLGGASPSEPAAVSQSPGSVDVFVRGTDDALWHTGIPG